MLPARRARPRRRDGVAHRSDAWVNSSLLFGLPTIVFALQYGLVRDMPSTAPRSRRWRWPAFYVLLATLDAVARRSSASPSMPASRSRTVFLTLVIPFALDERSTAGAWTLEGAGLVWIGFRQRRGSAARLRLPAVRARRPRRCCSAHERHGVPAAVFNAYLFNGLMAAAASLAAAFFVQRHAARGRAASERGRRASRC